MRGEDLAEELQLKQTQQTLRHRAELRMAAAADAHPAPDSLADRPYLPETFGLREISRSASKGKAVAVTSDESGNIWTLYNTGQLRHDSVSTLALPDTDAAGWLDTRWRSEDGAHVRIEVSSKSTYIAFLDSESASVQWMDVESRENHTITVNGSECPIDVRWLTTPQSNAPQLALITAEHQTLLIDPHDRQQLSGQSAVAPLALLPAGSRELGVVGNVVLSDRTIQPLQLSSPSDPADAEPTGPRLAFQPDQGPWIVGQEQGQSWTLARGWLATDEPALFLLDEQQKQRWHYRMPLQRKPSFVIYSVANDPTSGQAIWCS